eukprot:gene36029-43695_t
MFRGQNGGTVTLILYVPLFSTHKSKVLQMTKIKTESPFEEGLSMDELAWLTLDLQGSKHSLRAPGKQGCNQCELLVREDKLLQGIWNQNCVKIRKYTNSAFGEDEASDVGIHINKGQAGQTEPQRRQGQGAPWQIQGTRCKVSSLHGNLVYDK